MSAAKLVVYITIYHSQTYQKYEKEAMHSHVAIVSPVSRTPRLSSGNETSMCVGETLHFHSNRSEKPLRSILGQALIVSFACANGWWRQIFLELRAGNASGNTVHHNSCNIPRVPTPIKPTAKGILYSTASTG